MIIRIIPRIKGENEYSPDEVNVISDKSQFCCNELKEDFIGWNKTDAVFNFNPDRIYVRNVYCKYCPFCGEKISIELIETEYKKEYDLEVKKEEEEYLKRLRNLKPTPKWKVRKMKSDSKKGYDKVFQRYEK